MLTYLNNILAAFVACMPNVPLLCNGGGAAGDFICRMPHLFFSFGESDLQRSTLCCNEQRFRALVDHARCRECSQDGKESFVRGNNPSSIGYHAFLLKQVVGQLFNGPCSAPTLHGPKVNESL